MPVTLFVYREGQPEEEDSYLVAEETMRACGSLSEDRTVGIYRLEQVGTLNADVHLTEVEPEPTRSNTA